MLSFTPVYNLELEITMPKPTPKSVEIAHVTEDQLSPLERLPNELIDRIAFFAGADGAKIHYLNDGFHQRYLKKTNWLEKLDMLLRQHGVDYDIIQLKEKNLDLAVLKRIYADLNHVLIGHKCLAKVIPNCITHIIVDKLKNTPEKFFIDLFDENIPHERSCDDLIISIMIRNRAKLDIYNQFISEWLEDDISVFEKVCCASASRDGLRRIENESHELDCLVYAYAAGFKSNRVCDWLSHKYEQDGKVSLLLANKCLAFKCAVAGGNLEFVEGIKLLPWWAQRDALLSHNPIRFEERDNPFALAAENGRLDILQFLWQEYSPEQRSFTIDTILNGAFLWTVGNRDYKTFYFLYELVSPQVQEAIMQLITDHVYLGVWRDCNLDRLKYAWNIVNDDGRRRMLSRVYDLTELSTEETAWFEEQKELLVENDAIAESERASPRT